ncbi:DUF4294 domain-containing protein [Zhouia sp. PK063]|uniref:DUF4294 domain-containing protein n=1 Tax=Zhouia sp. PK063 TaxID=3373602 RepID=UPI003792B736
MLKKIILLLYIGIPFFVKAQHTKIERDSIYHDTINDHLVYNDTIVLQDVYIFTPLRFKSFVEKRKYYILKIKTLKVYPYAKLAADRLIQLNERLERIHSKSEKRKYTRIVQRYIEDEFKERLKKFTRTEGQILVKLIYRQTGITAFDLVKELRSGWKAFWYNTTAHLFDISLKEEYNPEVVEEDYYIEDILQRAFSSGQLTPQKSALHFDYAELTNKWK